MYGADEGRSGNRGVGMSADTETHEQAILRSWKRNAGPWEEAVRSGAIESRVLRTNSAIISAVVRHQPRKVLDVGCGEGWLARALEQQGVAVSGIDVVPQLVERARTSCRGQFEVMSYKSLALDKLAAPFDVVVCNFSLLGESSTEALLASVPALLAERGVCVIQTLHPLVACGDAPYRDGWREGSWAGFGPQFADPAPWYFRTIAGWISLLRRHGLTLLQLEEPIHPRTGKPASIIFTGGRDRGAASSC